MKILIKRILLLTFFSILFLSCHLGQRQKSTNNKDAQSEKIYRPSDEWSLVWADEFDKDVIDSKNWNFQEEEAGRFNDEWQRYTNSNKNAYIENG